MTYHCDNCKTALPVGATACPGCGKEFDSPVPAGSAGQDTPMEDLLRARTASGAPRTEQPGTNTPPATTLPAWYGTPRPARKGIPLWLAVSAGLVGALAILALIGWGADALWMRGPGGEIAFRQHNFAGNDAAEHGDFQKANDEYGQMIALRPRRVDGYLLRAISEFQAGQMTDSITDNTTALGLTQEPVVRGGLFYNRGEAYARRGKFGRAISDYSQSISEYAKERNPRMMRQIPEWQADDYRMRADAYWQHKSYAQAVRDCAAAISFGHPRPEDYGVRGKAESALGRDAAAQADFNQALRMDPSYLDGYIGLGDIAEKQHHPAAAVAVFQQATRIDPGREQFWAISAGSSMRAASSPRRLQATSMPGRWMLARLG